MAETPKITPTDRRMVSRFEKLVETYLFRGAGHPEDSPRIEQEYEDGKQALLDYIARQRKERL